jgi:hypothetical protein
MLPHISADLSILKNDYRKKQVGQIRDNRWIFKCCVVDLLSRGL